MAKTVEEQKGRIIAYKDFDLLKFKLTQKGSIISYRVKGISDHVKGETLTSEPHPDLTDKLDELKLYMATRIGYMGGWDFARDNIKDDHERLQKAIDGFNNAKENFKVTGVIYINKDEREAVQITGSLKCPDGGSSRLDVPYIYFGEDNSLDYADDVEQLVEEFKQEVYNYLILNKKHQSDVVDQAEGFDNEGGAQMDLITESQQADAPGGFDKNGERDFVPSDEQLKDIDVNEEE